jgi:hypothetical protein
VAMRILLTIAAAVSYAAVLGAQRAPLVLLVNIAEYFSDDYVTRRVPCPASIVWISLSPCQMKTAS